MKMWKIFDYDGDHLHNFNTGQAVFKRLNIWDNNEPRTGFMCFKTKKAALAYYETCSHSCIKGMYLLPIEATQAKPSDHDAAYSAWEVKRFTVVFDDKRRLTCYPGRNPKIYYISGKGRCTGEVIR